MDRHMERHILSFIETLYKRSREIPFNHFYKYSNTFFFSYILFIKELRAACSMRHVPRSQLRAGRPANMEPLCLLKCTWAKRILVKPEPSSSTAELALPRPRSSRWRPSRDFCLPPTVTSVSASDCRFYGWFIEALTVSTLRLLEFYTAMDKHVVNKRPL